MKKVHILYALIAISLLLSLGSRLYMTDRLPFIMDELVDTQIGVQLSKGTNLYSNYHWPRTPLMNHLLGFFVGGGENSFLTAITARKLMWICCVIIFFMTYLIARKTHGYHVAILATVFLCSFTTFLDRSIRVRADLLSTLFSLPALFILIYFPLQTPFFIAAGFFLGLAFITTQKALYFVIAFGLSLIGKELVFSGLNVKALKQMSYKAILCFAGFMLPVFALIIWLIYTNQIEAFIDNGLKHAAQSGLFSQIYKESTKTFLKQTIVRNPAIWALGVIGAIVMFLKGLKNKEKDNNNLNIRASYTALSLWTLVLLVLILKHNIKFPYLFLNIAPFLSISAAVALYYILLNFYKKPKSPAGLISIPLLIFVGYFTIIPSVFHHYKNLKVNPITQIQKAVMDRVDNITKPEDAVFDGIGMAVTRNKATPYSMTARWYNERLSGVDYNIIDSLYKSQPKVLINNYRMSRLNANEISFLNNHFLHDWANVFVAGKVIKHDGDVDTKKHFNLIASADYAVICDNKKNIIIDGVIPAPVIHLTAGDHEAIINGPQQTLILKYYPAVKQPLAPAKTFKLFPSYSD